MTKSEKTAGILALSCFIALVGFGEWAHRRSVRGEAPASQRSARPMGGTSDIEFVVFMRLHTNASQGATAEPVCPSVGGADIDDGVGRKLALLHLSVHPLSACVLKDGDYVEKKTGDPAIVLSIQSIAIQGDREAVVEASVSRGLLLAEGVRFKLRYAGNWWEIVSEERTWIS